MITEFCDDALFKMESCLFDRTEELPLRISDLSPATGKETDCWDFKPFFKSELLWWESLKNPNPSFSKNKSCDPIVFTSPTKEGRISKEGSNANHYISPV